MKRVGRNYTTKLCAYASHEFFHRWKCKRTLTTSSVSWLMKLFSPFFCNNSCFASTQEIVIKRKWTFFILELCRIFLVFSCKRINNYKLQFQKFQYKFQNYGSGSCKSSKKIFAIGWHSQEFRTSMLDSYLIKNFCCKETGICSCFAQFSGFETVAGFDQGLKFVFK